MAATPRKITASHKIIPERRIMLAPNIAIILGKNTALVIESEDSAPTILRDCATSYQTLVP
jgi:hypothetical protein